MVKVAASTPIRHLEFNRNGTEAIVNSTDRILRIYALDAKQAPTLLHKFQDLVNRIQYTACRFSYDGEYITAGSGQDHQIYIWDRNGTLVKILPGPKEGVEYLQARLNRHIDPDRERIVASVSADIGKRFGVRVDLHLVKNNSRQLEFVCARLWRIGAQRGVH